MTDTPLLSLRDLTVTFETRHGPLTPVDGISLEVQPGDILGFVGESGAGKSMTGSAIIGLIDPPGKITGGQVFWKGEDVTGRSEGLRGKEIGMIFQDPLTSLNPLKTVGDQLTETILTHLPVTQKEARERAAAALEEVGIDPERLRAYPHEFSGGMRQRVVVALALAAEPDLVIADEPTTALDVSVQAQILKLLRKICTERGAAVILITHDMGVIAETTDRVAVLYAGRLSEIGTTQGVLGDPQHPYTQGLMASTPKIDPNSLQDDLFQIPGSMPRLDALPSGCAFHPRCPKAMDRCLRERPELQQQRATCWLLAEGDAA